MYGIYVDYLFILNFSLDLLLLLAVKWTLGRTATRLRILLSAAFAGVGYCLLLLCTVSIRLKDLWGFGLLGALMILGAFGYGNGRLFLDSLLTLYGYSCVLGGLLLLLRRNIPGLFSQYALPGSLLAAVMVAVGVRKLCQHIRLRRQSGLYSVTLECNGETWELQGFLDTGNGLCDPVFHKPVNVLDARCSRLIQPKVQPEQLVLIPYHTVGNETGFFYGARVEKLLLHREEGEQCVKDALVAFSQREFQGEKQFQILLNPGILQE